MRKLLILIIIVSGCGKTEERFVISDFKQGLMARSDDGTYKIIKEGKKFDFEPTGSCVEVGVKNPECMWWGISFNHTTVNEDYKIHCKFEILNNTNTPVRLIDPYKEYEPTETEADFPILKHTSKSSFPFYVTKDEGDTGILIFKYECSDEQGAGFKSEIEIKIE